MGGDKHFDARGQGQTTADCAFDLCTQKRGNKDSTTMGMYYVAAVMMTSATQMFSLLRSVFSHIMSVQTNRTYSQRR